MNASVLRVTRATATIGIGAIHLLKSFINAGNCKEQVPIWQTAIHTACLFLALAIALADRLMSHSAKNH